MADANVAVTPGSGAAVDTRTQPGGDHRQVVVIGDAEVADVAAVGSAGTAVGAGLATRAGRTATSPTPARVAAATSSTQLLASNTARLGVVIHNDSNTANLFVKEGTAASATSYLYKVGPQQHLSLPDVGQPLYTGSIHGIWDAAVGAATVNEKV